MRKKLLTSIGLVLFLNLLIKPFWILGIDRGVQNLVGPSEYGFYFTILNFTFIFNILLDFGITNFNQRNIAQYNHLLSKYLSSILVLKILFSAVYILVIFVAALLSNFEGRQFEILGWLAFNQVLVSFILYFRSNITGLLMFKTDSLISILDRLLMIFICSILLWGNITDSDFQIEWFVKAQTFSYLLTAFVAGLIVFKKAKFKKLNWNLSLLIIIVRNSFPFALLVFLMSFYNRIDTVLLGMILPEEIGAEQSGIYASGYRLLDAANMIAFLVSFFLLPTFSRLLKNKSPIAGITKISFTLLYSISLIVATGCSFYSHEIMNLLYTSHTNESAEVFRLLMWGFVAISMNYVFGTLLTANGNLKHLNIIAIVSVVINLSINLIMIPRFLAVGSAYASLSAQFTAAIIQIVLVIIIFKFKRDLRFIGNIILFTTDVVAFNYFSQMIPIDWFYRFGIMLFCCFIWAFVTGFINIKGVFQIIKEKE